MTSVNVMFNNCDYEPNIENSYQTNPALWIIAIIMWPYGFNQQAFTLFEMLRYMKLTRTCSALIHGNIFWLESYTPLLKSLKALQPNGIIPFRNRENKFPLDILNNSLTHFFFSDNNRCETNSLECIKVCQREKRKSISPKCMEVLIMSVAKYPN